MKNIGNILSKTRTKIYKESAENFSKRIGISKTCLLNIENGITLDPSIDTLKKIEKAINISLDEYYDPRIKSCKSKTNKRFYVLLAKRRRAILSSFRSLNIFLSTDTIKLDKTAINELREELKQEIDTIIDNIIKTHENISHTLSDEDIDKIYKNSIHQNQKEDLQNE